MEKYQFTYLNNKSYLIILWIGILLCVILCPDFSYSNHLTSVSGARSNSRQNLGTQRRPGMSRINNQRMISRTNIPLSNRNGRRRISANCIPGSTCRSQVIGQRRVIQRNQRRGQTNTRRRGTNMRSSSSSRNQPGLSVRARSGAMDGQLRLRRQRISRGRNINVAGSGTGSRQAQQNVRSAVGRQSSSFPVQNRGVSSLGRDPTSRLAALQTISNLLPQTLETLINSLRANRRAIGLGIGFSSSGRGRRTDTSSQDQSNDSNNNIQQSNRPSFGLGIGIGSSVQSGRTSGTSPQSQIQTEVPNDSNNIDIQKSMDRIRQSFIQSRAGKIPSRKMVSSQNQFSMSQVPEPKPLVQPPLALDQQSTGTANQIVLQAPALDRGQLSIDQNTGQFTQKGGFESIFIDPTKNQNSQTNTVNVPTPQNQNSIVRNLNNQGLTLNNGNNDNIVQLPVPFGNNQNNMVQSPPLLPGVQNPVFGIPAPQFQSSGMNSVIRPGSFSVNQGIVGNNENNINNVGLNEQNNIIGVSSQIQNVIDPPTIVQNNPLPIVGLQSNANQPTAPQNQQNVFSGQSSIPNSQFQDQNSLVNNQFAGNNNVMDMRGNPLLTTNTQNDMMGTVNSNVLFQGQNPQNPQFIQGQIANSNIQALNNQGQFIGNTIPQSVIPNIDNIQRQAQMSFGNNQAQNPQQIMNFQQGFGTNMQGQGQIPMQTPEITFPAQPAEIVGQGPAAARIQEGTHKGTQTQFHNSQVLGGIKRMQDIATLLPSAQFAPMSTPTPPAATTPKRLVIAIDPNSKGIKIVPDGKGGVKVISLRHAITVTPWNESVNVTTSPQVSPQIDSIISATTPHTIIKDPELLRKLEATDRINTTDIPEEREINGQSLDGTYFNLISESSNKVTTPQPVVTNIKDPELLRKLEGTDRINTTDIPEEREVNGQSLDGTYLNPIYKSDTPTTSATSIEVGATLLPPLTEEEIEEEEVTSTEVTTKEQTTTSTHSPQNSNANSANQLTDVKSSNSQNGETASVVKRTLSNIIKGQKSPEPSNLDLKQHLIKVMKNSRLGKPSFELKIISLPKREANQVDLHPR